MGASEEGSSVHDPEFDRKFDRMFEIEGETVGAALCMVVSKRERCRKPALRK